MPRQPPLERVKVLLAFGIRRVLALIPTLLVISAITFFMGFLAPGDPITIMLGERATPAQVAQVKRQYGLDQPPLLQYGRYLGNLLRGDLGLSYFYQGRPVAGMVKNGFFITLRLGALAMGLATLLGVALGIVAAAYRNRWPDVASMFFAVIGVSLPNFVFAIFLMWLLGVKFKLVPPLGWGKPQHYVLPVLVLGIRSAAFIARITRSSMLEVLNQDYMRTARSKGLAAQVVVLKHGVRNALIPVITVLGTTLGSLLTGAFITESIFTVPGLGRVALDSILQRDYPVVQATTLLIATVFVVVNLVVDLLYGVVDPRIRYS